MFNKKKKKIKDLELTIEAIKENIGQLTERVVDISDCLQDQGIYMSRNYRSVKRLPDINVSIELKFLKGRVQDIFDYLEVEYEDRNNLPKLIKKVDNTKPAYVPSYEEFEKRILKKKEQAKKNLGFGLFGENFLNDPKRRTNE